MMDSRILSEKAEPRSRGMPGHEASRITTSNGIDDMNPRQIFVHRLDRRLIDRNSTTMGILLAVCNSPRSLEAH